MSEPVYNYNAFSPEEEPEMTERTRTFEHSSACTATKIGKAILWTSVGVAVVMGAMFAGLKLRAHRLRNRTPYDTFAHAGDHLNSSTEYGMGI